jgi:hypothetical protein
VPALKKESNFTQEDIVKAFAGSAPVVLVKLNVLFAAAFSIVPEPETKP